MWIIIRLLISIALLAVVEIYFIKKLGWAIKNLFRVFHQKQYKIIIFLSFIIIPRNAVSINKMYLKVKVL